MYRQDIPTRLGYRPVPVTSECPESGHSVSTALLVLAPFVFIRN
jgi:hypothetical protein